MFDTDLDGVEHRLGHEALQSELFLQVLHVALLVERVLLQVLEETLDLEAAEADGDVVRQALSLVLLVVGVHLRGGETNQPTNDSHRLFVMYRSWVFGWLVW